MAIQFHCPHCCATLKVSDAASGKKGICPKCGQGLIVPKIQIPPAPQQAPAGPVSPPAFAEEHPPESAAETAAAPPQELGDPLAFLEQVEPTVAVAGLRSSPARRASRRRRSVAAILIPLLFCAGFLAAGGWLYFREATTRLEGTLQAIALDEDVPPPGFVRHEDVDLPEDVFIDVLKQMQASPLPDVRSNLMEVDFAAQSKAIEVRLRSTPDTLFFRVDLSRDAALKHFRDEHGKQLNAPRRAELTRAATEMFQEWRETGGRQLNLSRYRDSVGLASLLGPLGYHLQAVIGGRIYRCVAEDGEGRVYFLLPPETKRFRIEGRELANERVLFPGKYDVDVVETDSRPGARTDSPPQGATGAPLESDGPTEGSDPDRLETDS